MDKTDEVLDEIMQRVNQFKSNTLEALSECRRSVDGTYRGAHAGIYQAHLESYDTVLGIVQHMRGKYGT